ncbi:MAG: DMT family transporter [Desulfovibrionaceae bacterium]
MLVTKNTLGHVVALLTICIWGLTFISTKVLLRDFSPVEVLFFRFCIGYICLLVAFPSSFKCANWRQELHFVGAGLCGVTLYFLFENIALTYTFASNVGVLVAVSPFLTALLAHVFLHGEALTPRFFVGFVVAIAGIMLMSFNGNVVLQLNPLGDILAILAAGAWAMYSILLRKISRFGFPTIACTRRIFFYGLLFMLPALWFLGLRWDFSRFIAPLNLLNLLFLGIGASAVCFATWSWSIKILGAVKASVYIYLVPVVTVGCAALILRENITPLARLGTGLTWVGLVISESKGKQRA